MIDTYSEHLVEARKNVTGTLYSYISLTILFPTSAKTLIISGSQSSRVNERTLL